MDETVLTPPAVYSKTFTGCLTDHLGTRRWFINGAYGRGSDLPTIEYADGSLAWFVENPKRGKFGQQDAVPHREAGPAIVKANGTEIWYRLGALHREDGPAVQLPDGTQKWFLNDKFIKMIRPG